MSKKKYFLKRDGNHFKLADGTDEIVEKGLKENKNYSFNFFQIKKIFGVLFSAIIFILTFLIATPFFLINLLINWIKLSIGFAIFWAIAYIVYDTIILNNMSLGVHPFNTAIVLTIMGLGFIASIFVTIAQIKE